MQIYEIKKILENKGLKSCGLTQLQLGFEVQFDTSKAIIKRIMGSLNYYKCLVCQRSQQSSSSKKNRVKYAKYILKRYSERENWDFVKFSNKIYFG